MRIQPPAPTPPPPAPRIVTIQGTGGAGEGSRVVVVQQQPGPDGGTRFTERDLDALRAQRSELSHQLTSAEGRRSELAKQLEGRQGADRQGIEQRITQLDQRILDLERAIGQTGQQIATVAGAIVPAPEPRMPGGLDDEQMTAVVIVFILAVLTPLAIAASRLLWRRATHPRPAAAAIPADTTERMQRLEQAVDTIAVEIERVSEGQRFVTQLLTEGRPVAAAPNGRSPALAPATPDARAGR